MGMEQGCLLSRMGDLTLGYACDLPEQFTLGDKDYEALHQAWVKAIRVLPKNSILHKQDWFLQQSYQPDLTGKHNGFLARASERFFAERPWLDHRCYLFISRKPAQRKPSSSLFSTLLRTHIVPPETLDTAATQEFLDSCSQCCQLLTDSGYVKLHKLEEADYYSGPQQVGLLEQYCMLNEDKTRPLLRDIRYEAGGMWIGNQQIQIFSLADVNDLPAVCGPRINFDKYATDRTKFSVGFASSLGPLLPCSHLYNQYIFIDDARQTLKKLEAKRLRLQSLSAYSRENAIARDAVNEFLNEAIREQRLPIKAHFNVMCWSSDPATLKEVRNLVSSGLAQMDAVPRQEVAGAPQIHWAGIPGNAADFPMNETFDSFAEQAVCFFNLETSYRSSASPFGIRLGERLTGRPLHVDISDEPVRMGVCTNRNKFILGPSGSGKSFFTNHMLRSYFEQGTHIVLVDVGHSYRGLCELCKGYYFTYSEASPIRFNPFWLGAGEKPDTEKKESIKTLLLALWKKDDESFGRAEYVALSNALQGYYEHLQAEPGLFAGFNSFYEYLQTGFSERLQQEKVKDKDFDLDNFLYVLRPYYSGGEFDYLLNATEHLDLLEQRFIVFELDNIKDHPILFPVVTLIIMDVFIAKMRKLKGIRKMILIEEAWKAIAREGMAEYIQYLFKTVRKHFGEAVVVTQEVEDIISSPIVKQAIINNSDCKILLDQSKYQNKFDQIQSLLGLTEKEKAQVLSMNRANEPGRRYKEVFISLGGIASKVYRTEVSPEEYYTYTTEEREKQQVNQLAAQLGSLEKGIQAMAAS